MNDKTRESLSNLKSKYPIDILEEGKIIKFKIKGIDEIFRASDSGNEVIISTDKWHEHFGEGNSYQDIVLFFDDLFSGRIAVVIKYRGSMAVAHSIQKFDKDGKVEMIISWSGNIISPFWRKKSYKKLDYIFNSQQLASGNGITAVSDS
ncbi:MAG TPA: hypothetical protein DCZ94_16410 [Lentisphaeria bacterium]|nr:MAG: hypothetical protein A2X48_01925 [Lentisphaerae bacterium GWF2_49_21]HBC88531.1 hypothetical protein [Lentisphaeria bacterium]